MNLLIFILMIVSNNDTNLYYIEPTSVVVAMQQYADTLVIDELNINYHYYKSIQHYDQFTNADYEDVELRKPRKWV